MKTLRAVYDAIQKVLKKFGDIMSAIILVVFYYSVFALFAIPARIFTDFLSAWPRRSSFVTPKKQFDTLASFSHEG